MLKIRDITFTKEDIDFIYSLYVDAVIELAKVCPIVEVKIFDRTPTNPKVDTINPYLTEDDEWLVNLGKSVLENGTHWVYIVRRRQFLSGNHRIMSLRTLAEKGLISRDHKVLGIDVTNSMWGKGIPIITLEASELDDIKEFGLKTKTIYCKNYRSWIESILRIPKMFKEVLFEYKQVTGQEYKSLLVINNIEELTRRAKND